MNRELPRENWSILTISNTTSWPNLDKVFAEGGFMRCDLFMEEKYNISRINDTWKNNLFAFCWNIATYLYINNLFLIPDLSVRPIVRLTCDDFVYDFIIEFMTCLWHHHWLSYELNKQKNKQTVLPYKGNSDIIGQGSWVNS